MSDPFDQLPAESPKAFAAFTLFRTLGPSRSQKAVAAKLGKSESTISVWCRKHNWHTRLAAAPSPPVPSPPSPLPSPPHFPFDQQPRETDKAFAAFTLYLRMGPARSVIKVADKIGVSRSVIQGWSQRKQWSRRVAAYNAHMAAIELKATEAIVAAKGPALAALHEAVRRQAWAEAEDLIVLVQDFKTRWRDSDRLPGFDAIIRALDLAFRLKQFAAGMPSEIKEVNTTHTGPDGGPIMVQFEAAVRKIYGQPAEVVDVKELPPAPPPTTP